MIRIENVTKVYAEPSAAPTCTSEARPFGRPVLDGISLELHAGQITVLLGPSGCGKTTLLKLINRLIPLSGGRILLGDQDVRSIDPIALRRRIGYVIQEAGLFPHYRVRDNVALVPRLLGWERERIAARVAEMMRLVNLPETLLDRFPRDLSGGQRQRVGVARALAGDPEILLMDEPFGAIDPVNRAFIQDEFRRIQDRVGKTVVMVTHDLDEALKLGDRIAILHEGRVAQFDTPARLLRHPSTPFVAEFLGPERAVRLLKTVTVGQAMAEWLTAASNLTLPLPGLEAGDSQGDKGDLGSVPANAPLAEALSRLVLKGRASLGVRDGSGREVGMLTLGDIEEALGLSWRL